MSHIPVLLDEVMEAVNATSVRRFIDATAGLGGYIESILEKNSQAEVLGIEWDETSLEQLKNRLVGRGLASRCVLVSGNYRKLSEIAVSSGFESVSGIIFDLGFSSFQIDDPKRGFSFQADGPLDMRFDRKQKLTARDVVNSYPEQKLAQIINEYGEEKFSRSIARNIVAGRKDAGIDTTVALANLIKASLPGPIRHKAADHIRQVFQAIRIEVNDELENVQQALPQAFQVLEPKGRLAVISFHSLEDRIVKNYFKSLTKNCVCPPDFPECRCDARATAKIITKKPKTAGDREFAENPRSRSAKLRVLEKI